jgi:hypothetical protein
MKSYTIEELQGLFKVFLLEQDNIEKDEIYATTREFYSFGGHFIEWLVNRES